ncbi:hypothetical protein GUJ93_ZPchr0002g23821 [Zizania palustris]|uniref:Uncharacterized protein n=1 Tax=Zizania palustris TaxID=103762 RepID=A0A8J5VE24_ZIZPA|nr:hypothetical protein GUJ93_ZPchr0002g23821 [Zizania palustris]
MQCIAKKNSIPAMRLKLVQMPSLLEHKAIAAKRSQVAHLGLMMSVEVSISRSPQIFEDNQTRLPSWYNNEADMLPFCQILGEYKNKMLLLKFNMIEPYSNMNENCPSLPPTNTRPLGC